MACTVIQRSEKFCCLAYCFLQMSSNRKVFKLILSFCMGQVISPKGCESIFHGFVGNILYHPFFVSEFGGFWYMVFFVCCQCPIREPISTIEFMRYILMKVQKDVKVSCIQFINYFFH